MTKAQAVTYVVAWLLAVSAASASPSQSPIPPQGALNDIAANEAALQAITAMSTVNTEEIRRAESGSSWGDPSSAAQASCGPWLKYSSPTAQNLFGVTFADGRFVAVGGGGVTVSSTDGGTWTLSYSPVRDTLTSVAWNGSVYVAVGVGGAIVWSSNGRSWTQAGSPTSKELRGIAWNGSTFVAVGQGGTVLTSPDGKDWQVQTVTTTAYIFAVAAFNGAFIAIDDNGLVLRSTNGLAWSSSQIPAFPTYASILGMAASSSMIVGVGFDVTGNLTLIYTSTDGLAWTKATAPTGVLRGVTASGPKLVAVGDGIIVENTDGTDWVKQSSPMTGRTWGVTWGPQQYLAVGDNSIGRSACTSEPPPTAAFTWSPAAPTAGQEVSFTDTSAGNPTVWSWDFGDQGNAQGQNPTHTFAQPGQFQVTLTASNASGSSTVTHQVTVTGAASHTKWIPVASHAPGVGGSQWRTDAGLLNPGPEDAAVTVRWHGQLGVLTTTTTVVAGGLSVLDDVVAQVSGASGSAAIEVVSSQPLDVSSRTYNLVPGSSACYPGGTFGQDYPGVESSSGLSVGEVARLNQLAENPKTRTNIGLVNTGTVDATVIVTLLDATGDVLTSYLVTLPPGAWKQETRPFFNKAGQTNMTRGYAAVYVTTGSGVFAFASVIDNTTGDPTTIRATTSQ